MIPSLPAAFAPPPPLIVTIGFPLAGAGVRVGVFVGVRVDVFVEVDVGVVVGSRLVIE